MIKKIHFINRIDLTNIGDARCCPLNYYFYYFQQYNLMRHDIDYIDWNEINPQDIVIIGGGGMLNVTQSFNSTINMLLNKCDCVIAWSVGFNTHDQQWFQGDKFEEINLDKFELISIRDFNHPTGTEWVPCPSALSYELDTTGVTTRKFGIIEHKSIKINGLPYDKITNSSNLQEVADFISTTDTILTNSYHMTYWAQLMGKKVIVLNKFSTKFDYFKYPPVFIPSTNNIFTTEEIEAADIDARTYNNILVEARNVNNSFFNKVKNIIEERDFPVDNSYQRLYQLTDAKSWNKYDLLNKVLALSDSKSSVSKLMDDLHDELHKRIDEEIAQVHARITERDKENDNKLSAKILKKLKTLFKTN